MIQKKTMQRVSILLAISASLLFGCVGTDEGTPVADASTSAGAKLWAENCIRCHNLRPPDSYSDVEWRIIVHHMRVRANLTAEEHRAILGFLTQGF